MPGTGLSTWSEHLVCIDCLREALKTVAVDPRKGPIWQEAKDSFKSYLPTDVQKTKALMAASPLASPVRLLQEAFPDYLCPECPSVRLCPATSSVWLCVLPAPRLTFRHGLNLILLLYISWSDPVWVGINKKSC